MTGAKRRVTGRGAVPVAGVLAALLLTGCGVADHSPVSAPAATGTPERPVTSSRGETTYLAECSAQVRVKRPETLVLACGDGGEMLQGLIWRGWGEQDATAAGELVSNDCVPSCAEGSDVRVPVTVRADELQDGDGVSLYRRLTVTTSDQARSGAGSQVVYQLPGFDEAGESVPPDAGPGSPSAG